MDTLRITRTQVVELGEADFAELHDLRLRSADYFSEHGEPAPTAHSLQSDLDNLPEGYSRRDEIVYRALEGEALTGYAVVLRGFADSTQWLVASMLVDQSRRCGGVGTMMVDAIAADAAAQAVQSLIAGVFAGRERARSFWVRQGFDHEVTRRVVLVDDLETEIVRLERRL